MFGHSTQEPSPSDEGVFITEDDLADWFVYMQERFPEEYPPDTSPYGPDHLPQRQHPLGTKLMTYQDNDPKKSMRCEVRGSRWIVEFGMRSPVYVVKFRGLDDVLGHIELLSAHKEEGERWSVGWDVPPPPAKAKPETNVNGEKGKA